MRMFQEKQKHIQSDENNEAIVKRPLSSDSGGCIELVETFIFSWWWIKEHKTITVKQDFCFLDSS